MIEFLATFVSWDAYAASPTSFHIGGRHEEQCMTESEYPDVWQRDPVQSSTQSSSSGGDTFSSTLAHCIAPRGLSGHQRIEAGH